MDSKTTKRQEKVQAAARIWCELETLDATIGTLQFQRTFRRWPQAAADFANAVRLQRSLRLQASKLDQ